MFTNNVKLTDDELSAIQSSLLMSIKAYNKHISRFGKDSLDNEAVKGIEEMKKVFDKFNEEYFEYDEKLN